MLYMHRPKGTFHSLVRPGWRMLILTTLVWLPHAVQAQERSPNHDTLTLELPMLEVEGSRLALYERPGRRAYRVPVIQDQAATLADVATGEALLFVRQYGPSGSAALSVGGGSAGHVQVRLDGIPIGHAGLGQTDLSLLPAAFLEDVVLTTGTGSVAIGSGAVAGAVFARTPTLPANDAIDVSLGAGSFGKRQIVVALPLAWLHHAARITTVWHESTGDFPYDHPTRPQLGPLRRQGADFSQRGVQVQTSTPTAGGLWTGRGFWVSTDRGLPGPITSTPRGERQHDVLWLAGVEAHHVLAKDRIINMRLGWRGGTLRYENPSLQIDDLGKQRSGFLSLAHHRPWQSWLESETTIEHESTTLSHPSLERVPNQQTTALAHVWSASAKSVEAQVGLRLDHQRASTVDKGYQVWSPDLGIVLKPSKRLPVALGLQYGEAFRAPTINDRHWQPGGNPNLLPERGRGGTWYAEGDVTFYRLHVRLEAGGFWRTTDQLIIWVPTEKGFWSPQNIARTLSQGYHVEGSWRLERDRGYWSWTGHVAWTDAVDAGTRLPLRYVPKTRMTHVVALAHSKAVMRVWLDHTGRRYSQADGQGALVPYTVVSASLAHVISVLDRTVRVTLGGQNLFNTVAEPLLRYPLSPRTWSVHVGVTL